MRYKVVRYVLTSSFEEGLNKLRAEGWLLDSWRLDGSAIIAVYNQTERSFR